MKAPLLLKLFSILAAVVIVVTAVIIHGSDSGARANAAIGRVNLKPALLGVSVSVTPTTPMWELDAHVTLDPSRVICPVVLTVTIGHMATTAPNMCAGGAAPSHTDVFVPVFDHHHPAHNLGPGTSAPVTAQLTDAAAEHSSVSNTAQVPPRPIWIGIGDSFSSGHHQDRKSTLRCPWALQLCRVYANDPAFSWVTKAATQLNNLLLVPGNWQMTSSVQAASGSSTQTILTKQVPKIMALLQKHAGSWNVVSLTGGANDTNWVVEIGEFYLVNSAFHTGDVPWEVQQNGKNGAGCLNTQAIWANLDQTAPTIQANLQQSVNDAIKADPNVRIVDVNYPYLIPTTDRCSQDVVAANQKVIWHGSKSVIDRFDALQNGLFASNGHLTFVDLRANTGFGVNPLGDLQLISLYGYPHPNRVGQSSIAALAVHQVRALN